MTMGLLAEQYQSQSPSLRFPNNSSNPFRLHASLQPKEASKSPGLVKPVQVIATMSGPSGRQPDGRTPSIMYHKDSVFHQRVELYRGSVSVVYKAVCASTKRNVIVKAYKTHKMTQKQLHKSKREIVLMQQLRDDPGVVQYLGHFEDQYMTFIVMEHCRQGDLFRTVFLKGGSVEEEWAVSKIVTPLLEVLTRLHKHNILHRDIKPENIFLTSEWQLKLGDFGLAIDANQELPFTRSGTLDYMAPEVLANPATDLTEGLHMTIDGLNAKHVKPYNDKVDVWAVGILCYELIVGKPPFEVENEQSTMHLIMKSNKINFPVQFSKEWADFIVMALRKRPEQRPSAHELLQHPWIVKYRKQSPAQWSTVRPSQSDLGTEAGKYIAAIDMGNASMSQQDKHFYAVRAGPVPKALPQGPHSFSADSVPDRKTAQDDTIPGTALTAPATPNPTRTHSLLQLPTTPHTPHSPASPAIAAHGTISVHRERPQSAVHMKKQGTSNDCFGVIDVSRSNKLCLSPQSVLESPTPGPHSMASQSMFLHEPTSRSANGDARDSGGIRHRIKHYFMRQMGKPTSDK